MTVAFAATFRPPFVAPAETVDRLAGDGFAMLDPGSTAQLVDVPLDALAALSASWDDLPPDAYLKDGGAYRRRRHACFVVDGPSVVETPRRPHWQPVEYNALHGGMQRWFEPVDGAVVATPAWTRLIAGLGAVCGRVRPEPRWFVEAHQFRIDTAGGIGRPTPEGAHRDGVDFVAVILVARRGVKGGETRVFDAAGPDGRRFTMTEPWTMLLLDDARVIHETTPIQPLGAPPAPDGPDAPDAPDALDALDASAGVRDTLVVTLRAGGFQGDAVGA